VAGLEAVARLDVCTAFLDVSVDVEKTVGGLAGPTTPHKSIA
jgi:hypothetical protein